MQIVQTKTGILYVGRAPTTPYELIDHQFNIIWNLAAEYADLKDIEANFSDRVLLGNIEDYGVPEDVELFTAQLKEVVDCLRNNGSAFVHCAAGCGRTGMVLACIMHCVNGLSIKSSLAIAKKICNGPENEKQIKFIEQRKWLSTTLP